MCDDIVNMADEEITATSCIHTHTLNHHIGKTDGGKSSICSNVGTKEDKDVSCSVNDLKKVNEETTKVEVHTEKISAAFGNTTVDYLDGHYHCLLHSLK